MLTATVGKGQTNVYHPFPDTNAFWGDRGWNIFYSYVCRNTRFGLNGDTLINGKNYKKIYSLYDSTLTNPNSTYYAAIREENKRIYTIIGSSGEQILYDFNLSLGDTITYYYSILFQTPDTFYRKVTTIDSILLLDGKYRKRYTLDPVINYSLSDIVVEGIGSIRWWGLFNPLVNDAYTNGDQYSFECFKQNDTVLYLNNPLCNHCFCQLLTDITSTKEQEKFIIFPNPFSTQTTLKIYKDFKDATLTVYNSFGQQVKQINNISGQSITLQRDNLPDGLYFINLIQNDKTFITGKLIITDN